MLSVIIPNYNHAPYLKKRIDSVLNQTYQNIEVIILDDCSTDNSREIIEQYRNNAKVSHIIYNETNSGSTFKQWEKGISLSKGEFIWIAESDDWAEDFMLEKLISAFDNQTAISYCKSYRVWSEDNLPAKKDYTFSFDKYDGNTFVKQNMLVYNSIENASMSIFRKKFVDLFWFNKISDMKYCGDWMFWVKLAEKGNVAVFPEAYNYFRQHPVKVTSWAQCQGLDFIEGTQILKYIESRNIIRVPSSVIKYWAQVWVKMKPAFEKGVTLKTFKALVSFRISFLYYILLSLIERKFGIKKS